MPGRTGTDYLTDDSTAAQPFTRRLLVEHQRAAPVIIFLLILTITIVSVVAIERGEAQRGASQRARVALAVSSALERRASINASYLRAGAAVFALQDDVAEPMFRRFVTELRLDTDYRGAEGIGWAPVITPAQIPSFETRLSEELGRRVTVRPLPDAGDPSGILTPVMYLRPDTARNRLAIGFDMSSEEVRREAMNAAVKDVRPTASGRIVLVQEGNGSAPGFIMYMPVFDDRGGTRRLKGFVFSPYNAQDFLDAASEVVDAEGMQVTLYDGPAGSDTLMGSAGNTDVDPGESLGSVTTQELRLANRPMTLSVRALRSGSLTPISMVTLLLGLMVASLLMLVSRLLTKQIVEDQRALAWFAEQNSIRNSLTRELNHRVKNTLANVLSIVTLTRRRAANLDEFADGLDGRIRALSATHDLLTQSEWGTTPISAVVAAELAPYTKQEDGVLTMSGPPVELAPNDALSLGLALHELATNASKYGALSVVDGSVEVSWSMEEKNLARIEWIESGGPEVPARRPRGFGTDLIEKIVAHELRHPVDLSFKPEGVRCTLLVPVRQPVDFALRTTPRGVTGK
ncbi:CHASE domain-containing protein [Qipengyuania sp.]|uniref:CHASE domain-containing protein n=1 Tax=Qipengyuania sp. TaxID=2004515 RepID=UPI0035C87828